LDEGQSKNGSTDTNKEQWQHLKLFQNSLRVLHRDVSTKTSEAAANDRNSYLSKNKKTCEMERAHF
jgi:hypothetical protein